MRSIRYYLLKLILKKIIKRPIITKETLHKVRAQTNNQHISSKLAKDVNITPMMIQNIHFELYEPSVLNTQSVLFYIHGGGFCMGSLASHRTYLMHLAQALGMRILAGDYALAPEHPFPTALNQIADAFEWLTQNTFAARNIVLAGESAGGNLILSLLMQLRDEKKELPEAALLFSPWVDLTLQGDSYEENKKSEHYIHKDSVSTFVSWYLKNTDARDERASPLLGHFALLPPLFVQYSDTELFSSDSIRLIKKAKDADVHVEESRLNNMPHAAIIFYPLMPEAYEAMRAAKDFLIEQKILPLSARTPLKRKSVIQR
ncbi:MAG: alpha/beta hydrolase [Candidatus Nucleicultricaceae bacterium]